jgi:hypothetical protein
VKSEEFPAGLQQGRQEILHFYLFTQLSHITKMTADCTDETDYNFGIGIYSDYTDSDPQL